MLSLLSSQHKQNEIILLLSHVMRGFNMKHQTAMAETTHNVMNIKILHLPDKEKLSTIND